MSVKETTKKLDPMPPIKMDKAERICNCCGERKQIACDQMYCDECANTTKTSII